MGGEQWEKRGDTGTGRGVNKGAQKGECLRDGEGGRLKVNRRERECRIQIERQFCNVTVFKLLCCFSD